MENQEFSTINGLPVPSVLQNPSPCPTEPQKITMISTSLYSFLRRDLSSLSWLSSILVARPAQLEGQLFCSWNKSHGLQENIQPFCEANFLPAENLLEEFAKMLGWIWEKNMFPVLLIDPAGLAVFSRCTSGPVVMASCLAVAQLALSIFVTDQAVPWQIIQPFPLFANHLI